MQWDGRALVAADAPATPLLVADSWVVAEGVQRAAGAHWERFTASCLQAGADRDELHRFRAAASAALPAAGRWFARVELTDRGLALRLRPAPRAQRTARVLAGPRGDPRTMPLRKGPDLDLLASLRAGARAQGADELLLRDERGALLEGALSSLLWWEDDVLCTTRDEHALPGVTRALLIARARARGVEVRRRAPQPEELGGRETWLTSALHGIRVVDGWLSPQIAPGAGERAAQWREELDRDG